MRSMEDSYEDDGDENIAYSDDSSIIEPVRNSPSRASDKTSVSFIRNGRVRIVPNSTPVMTRQKVNTKVTMKQEEYDRFIEAENERKGIKKQLKRKYQNSKVRMQEDEVLDKQEDAEKEAMEVQEREKRKTHQGS